MTHKPETGSGAKIFFVVVAACVGIGTFLVRSCEPIPNPSQYGSKVQFADLDGSMITLNILIAFASGIAYVLMGAIVVRICAGLRAWAHHNQCETWSEEDRIFFGAVWPLTLIVSLLLYAFLGIIHRLF